MVVTRTQDSIQQDLMRTALREARQSTADTSARFRVGAVLVEPTKNFILATGHTAELPGNTHAEECALNKLFEERGQDRALELLRGAHIYTTLQPCTDRLSGLKTCTDRLVDARIARCYIGAEEPNDFVRNSGYSALEAVGVEIIIVDGLAEECLAVARGKELNR